GERDRPRGGRRPPDGPRLPRGGPRAGRPPRAAPPRRAHRGGPGGRSGPLRAGPARARRRHRGIRRHRPRARADRLGHRERGAPQPFPRARRALDRPRVHERPDVRAAPAGDGAERPRGRRAHGERARPPRGPRAMGRTDLADDARMTTTPARLAHRGLVDDLVAGWVAARDASGALAALEAAEVPSALVASVRDLFEDAHVKARENIVSVALPLLGRLAMPGVVLRLTLTPGRIDSAGPSRPGEHNDEIYRGRLGLSPEALARLAPRGGH